MGGCPFFSGVKPDTQNVVVVVWEKGGGAGLVDFRA